MALYFENIKRANSRAERLEKTVYYLPGRGGQFITGLGKGLVDRGISVVGRETLGQFLKLTFQQQIDAIQSDLQDKFWYESARLVAVSYGAYLFLHAQLSMPSFPGRVLLLSPVLGRTFATSVGVGFIPPRADKLGQAVEAKQFPKLKQAEIHVGSEDWQSKPDAVAVFGEALSIPVNIVEGKGHMLGADYVSPLLDRWLKNDLRRTI